MDTSKKMQVLTLLRELQTSGLEGELQSRVADAANMVAGEMGFISVSRIHEDDIRHKGWLPTKDGHMERLADKMGDDYSNQLFHQHAPTIAEILGFKSVFDIIKELSDNLTFVLDAIITDGDARAKVSSVRRKLEPVVDMDTLRANKPSTLFDDLLSIKLYVQDADLLMIDQVCSVLNLFTDEKV